MDGDEQQRMCAICSKNVHNLSDQSLKTISENYVDSGRCVQLNSDQVQYFQLFRSLSKVAGLTAALSLFPVVNTYAQEQNTSAEFCIITGEVKSNIVSNRTVFVVVNGRTIETKSNAEGAFKLMVPKGETIQHSNVRKLNDKTLDTDFLKLRKVRMPKLTNFIGTPSF